MSDHDHDVPELDDALRDLLASEHARPDVPAEMSARLLARVHATIAAPVAADLSNEADASPVDAATSSATTSSVTTAVATTGSALLTKGAIGIALVSFVAGAGVGVIGHANLATPPEPEVRVVVREVIRNVAAPATPAPPIPPPEAVARTAADAGARVPEAGVDAGAPTEDAGEPETGRDLGLADENALVSRAQTALARGRAGEALEALSEHQRRFPRGQFTEEREALAIQALSRLGRMEQAVARAERFRARYPGSLMMRVVDAAVRTP